MNKTTRDKLSFVCGRETRILYIDELTTPIVNPVVVNNMLKKRKSFKMFNKVVNIFEHTKNSNYRQCAIKQEPMMYRRWMGH